MVENWYPIKIYFHDNIENPVEIYQEIKYVEDQLEDYYISNAWNDNVRSTYGVIPNVILKYNLSSLNKFLYRHVVNYMVELNVNPSKLYLESSWFNKIEKYGYQDRHIHSYHTISGCYYFEDSMYDEEGIVFINTNKFGKEENIKYSFCVNRLILFPGLLEHAVKYKKTDGVRKSISFNFKIDL